MEDTKPLVKKGLEGMAAKPWGREILAALKLAERHLPLTGLLITAATAAMTFVLRWGYDQILQCQFTYYGLPRIKVETSMYQIIAFFLAALVGVFVFILASGFAVFVVQRRAGRWIKIFDFLMLTTFYTFIVMVVMLASMQNRFSKEAISCSIGVTVFGGIFFEFLLVTLRDLLGSCLYHTQHWKRVFIFLLVTSFFLVTLAFLPFFSDFIIFARIYFSLELSVFLLCFFVVIFFKAYSTFRITSSPSTLPNVLFDKLFLPNKRPKVGRLHVFLGVCGCSLVILLLNLTLTVSPLLQSIVNFGKAFQADYTILENYQDATWAVVYDTSDTLYLAPVEIDGDTISILPQCQMTDKKGLLLYSKTFLHVKTQGDS